MKVSSDGVSEQDATEMHGWRFLFPLDIEEFMFVLPLKEGGAAFLPKVDIIDHNSFIIIIISKHEFYCLSTNKIRIFPLQHRLLRTLISEMEFQWK